MTQTDEVKAYMESMGFHWLEEAEFWRHNENIYNVMDVLPTTAHHLYAAQKRCQQSLLDRVAEAEKRGAKMLAERVYTHKPLFHTPDKCRLCAVVGGHLSILLEKLEGRPLPTEPQANYYICCACHSVQEDCCDSCIALHNPQPKAGA